MQRFSATFCGSLGGLLALILTELYLAALPAAVPYRADWDLEAIQAVESATFRGLLAEAVRDGHVSRAEAVAQLLAWGLNDYDRKYYAGPSDAAIAEQVLDNHLAAAPPRP